MQKIWNTTHQNWLRMTEEKMTLDFTTHKLMSIGLELDFQCVYRIGMHAMMNCSFLNTINRLHNTTGSEIKSIIMRNIERNIVVGVVFHTLANAISFDFQPLFMREFMKILSDHKTRTDDQREIRFHRFKRPYQIHKINSNAGNSMSIKKGAYVKHSTISTMGTMLLMSAVFCSQSCCTYG